MTKGSRSTPTRDDDLTAFHEAGHVWAYRRHRKPIRYVTIRGRGRHGGVVTWRRQLDPTVQSCISVAGPVAQGLRDAERRRPGGHWLDDESDPDWLELGDYLVAAMLEARDGDWQRVKDFGPLSTHYWDRPEIVRDQLISEWPSISRLAAALLASGTLSGRAAFDVLDQAGSWAPTTP